MPIQTPSRSWKKVTTEDLNRTDFKKKLELACSVMVIVVENGHGDMSSNPV